jgi:hypothetical protein
MTLKCYLKLEATEIERLRNGRENNMEIDTIKRGGGEVKMNLLE